MKPFHIYLYGPSQGPLTCSFEVACRQLQSLPGMFLELDGSFVWRPGIGAQSAGGHPATPQLDGMLYDAADQIQYVDLKGQCQQTHFRQICQCLALPPDSTADILVLPSRDLQTLQGFEQSVFGCPKIS
ncbi:MAG: hypothetical protein AAGA03_00045 [Planctomycetota bacterium]